MSKLNKSSISKAAMDGLTAGGLRSGDFNSGGDVQNVVKNINHGIDKSLKIKSGGKL